MGSVDAGFQDQEAEWQLSFQVIRSADRVILLRARMQFACIELSSGRPRRLPRAFLEGYGPAVLDKNTHR